MAGENDGLTPPNVLIENAVLHTIRERDLVESTDAASNIRLAEILGRGGRTAVFHDISNRTARGIRRGSSSFIADHLEHLERETSETEVPSILVVRHRLRSGKTQLAIAIGSRTVDPERNPSDFARSSIFGGRGYSGVNNTLSVIRYSDGKNLVIPMENEANTVDRAKDIALLLRAVTPDPRRQPR